METKANFVLIGAVTVLGILGVLGFLIWFAKIEIDRQYALYDVRFDSVSGLGMAGDVRYNGLSVGQVVALDLDPEDPSKVRVRIEVDAGTPVKTDTTAQLSSQGVTGVSFVALSGGSAGAPLLIDSVDAGTVPEIPAERSVVQALTEDAPDLVEEAIAAIRELRSFLSDENRASVATVLQNLESASGQLETALSDFSDISRTVSDGTAQISSFTGRLDAIGTTVQETLVNVSETLEVAKTAIAEVSPTMQAAQGAFTTADATLKDVDALVQTRVPDIADDLETAIASIETTSTQLRTQLDTVLGQFGGTAEIATQRLAELEATIATLDLTLAEARTSMAAVESASVSFEGLMEGEGAALVADARQTLAMVEDTITGLDKTFKEDVPAIVSDVRSAVTTATNVVEQVSADLSKFSDRLDPLVTSGETALTAATETLGNANRTLANLDRALGTTEETLIVARSTFAEAETAITTDLGPAIADVRTAAGQFGDTMATLSDDIPAVTRDLRTAMARALEVIDQIKGTVSASAPSIQTFARTGLPEFTQFALEAQKLVTGLEQLTRKMERDPARFFFGNNIPEFRR